MPRKTKRTFHGDKAAALRYKLHVWGHNALFGVVRMALVGMGRIIESQSTTERAKRNAGDAAIHLRLLQDSLQIRVDPPELFEMKEERETHIPF